MQLSPENHYTQLFRLVDQIKEYAIFLIDPEGLILTWNQGAERIKGYSQEEIVGRDFRIFYSPEDRRAGKPDHLLQIAWEKGQAFEEGWRIRKDGSHFWAGITITAIHDDKGQLAGFGKVTRDLTDKWAAEEIRKEYLKKLERKNKELEQFTFIASHDLQEPLVVIESFVDLIRQEHGGQLAGTADAYFDFIERSTARMRRLIKGVLEYLRMGENAEFVMVDAGKVVSEALADLSRSGLPAIEIGELPCLKAYPNELRLLFRHLIDNAIKFSRNAADPLIRISAVEQTAGWEFTVEDNGIGIAEKDRERVFHIFKRLNNRQDYEGEGIGLSHCKKIAELHGGDIWIESANGPGCRVRFIISKTLDHT
jgi:PAS domain S-box-containing protein